MTDNEEALRRRRREVTAELRRALEFYERSPDSQYDEVAAKAIRRRIAEREKLFGPDHG